MTQKRGSPGTALRHPCAEALEWAADAPPKRQQPRQRVPGASKRALEPTEAQEQAVVLSWWASYCRTKGLDERLLVASVNGSYLAGDARARAIQMHKLKATGLRVGYPDLILDLPLRSTQSEDLRGYKISWPVVLFHGWKCELKRKGGPKPTPEQASYHALLRAQGYNVVVAVGAEEAIRCLKEYVEKAT